MGTSWCESAVTPLRFSRSHRPLVDETKSASFFANNQNPFSLQKNSRDSVAYAEKKTLPRVSVGVSQSVRVATIDKVKTVPLPGSGIWTGFPFGCNLVSLHTVKSPNIWLRLPLSLRIDWLVSNGCSHETLLHFGPPGPLWSICYYHQDLHQGRLHPSSHLVGFCATPATNLLVVA